MMMVEKMNTNIIMALVQSQIDRSFQDVYGEDPQPKEVEKLCSTLDKQREGLQFLTDILS